jgi:hypothetical protein
MISEKIFREILQKRKAQGGMGRADGRRVTVKVIDIGLSSLAG